MQLPKIKLEAVAARRDLYMRCMLAPERKILDDHVIRLVRVALRDALPEAPSVADNTAQTLLLYRNEKLTISLARVLATQLAARENELIQAPLEKFTVSNAVSAWAPLEVLGVQQAVWRNSKPGAELRLECLAGQPAGHVFHRKFPLTWLTFLAYKIGFSRKFQYPDEIKYFVGLRFWAHIMPVEAPKLQLDFSDWNVDNQCRKHNQGLIKLRLRYDLDLDLECPKQYEHDCIACHTPRDQCPASMLTSAPEIKHAQATA